MPGAVEGRREAKSRFLALSQSVNTESKLEFSQTSEIAEKVSV